MPAARVDIALERLKTHAVEKSGERRSRRFGVIGNTTGFLPRLCWRCATFLIVGQESGRRPKFDLDQHTIRPSDGQDEHRSFNVTVGEAIRRARQEHGWTQAFLAEQSGLSPNYIARLERGELGPSLFVASRICAALSIDIEELVTPNSAGGPVRKISAKRRAIAG